MNWPEKLFKFLALLVIMTSTAGCNDTGWETSETSNSGGGWVEVTSFSAQYTDQGSGYADLSGTAFVSFNYVRHRCAGYSCFDTYFDDSDPGVTVWWENVTSTISGAASSRYGTLTDWKHRWSAAVPLVIGSNEIIVRAQDPGGKGGTDRIIIDHVPPPPKNVLANTGNGRIILMWDPVPGVNSYNVYWSTDPGVEPTHAAFFQSIASPFVQDGLVNGQEYFYRISSNSVGGESAVSDEVAGVAGAASRPTALAAEVSSDQVVLQWEPVTGATRYDIYWSHEPGVTRKTGRRIADVQSPFVLSGLEGLDYYYVVTATNDIGQSCESEEVKISPPMPPPPPKGLRVSNEPGSLIYGWRMELDWDPVPGATFYIVGRCAPAADKWGNYGYCSLQSVGDTAQTHFVNYVSTGYYGYSVRARNEFGTGEWSPVIYTNAPGGIMGYVYGGY